MNLRGISRLGSGRVKLIRDCSNNPLIYIDPSGLSEQISLYRAVGQVEFDSLTSTNKFTSVDGTMDAKFFAQNYDDAVKWGNRLNGEGNFKVIEMKIDKSVVNDPNKFMTWEKLDSIGPAHAAESEVLNKEEFTITEAKSDSSSKNKDDKNDKGGSGGGTGISRNKPLEVKDESGRIYSITRSGNITRSVNIPDYSSIRTHITDRRSDTEIFYSKEPSMRLMSRTYVSPINPNAPVTIFPSVVPVY